MGTTECVWLNEIKMGKGKGKKKEKMYLICIINKRLGLLYPEKYQDIIVPTDVISISVIDLLLLMSVSNRSTTHNCITSTKLLCHDIF